MESTQFGGNIWANQKLAAEYIQPQPASGMVVGKQWKPICTSTTSTLRMPPGLALPASSHQQRQISQLQMFRQACSVPPAVMSSEAGWLRCVEPADELTAAGRCHGQVPNGNAQNTGGQDSEQYQQQQALFFAQVQATLQALQNCPQQQQSQPVSGEHASVTQASSPRAAELSHFGIAYRKPDEPQTVMNAEQSIFVNGKDARVRPISNAAINPASVQLQLQHVQQGQIPDLSKCMINTGPTYDRETGVSMQRYPVPQQAFVQNVSGGGEPFSHQPVPATSRRLLPAGFQDSGGQPFMRSAAVPLNVSTDRVQFDQNQLLVHSHNARQSPYSQYTVTSNASAEHYNMVGRLTPVMVGPAGDLFCSSIPSQLCTVPSPVMVGSRFPR